MEYQLINPITKKTLLEQVFYNRGFKTLEEANIYLNTTDENILSPQLIDNISKGARMLISHISQNHDALLQIDSDADGFTSAAILMNYLNRLFPNYAQNHIKYWVHDSKAHGIDEMGLNDKIKLILCPDASSNEFEKHKELAKKGIDILIIDHHNAAEVSEYACIINNQLCDYPTKSLSGAGMVYKFCSYIDELLGVNYADDYLDLASLGIIADVMDLRDLETKHIISRGLKNIRNPFLKLVIDNDERYFPKGKPVSIKSIAWSIGPLVNAVTRIGTIEEKHLLFESMIEFLAYEQVPSTKRGCKGQMETRVEQSVRTCKNIKNRQDKSRDSLVAKVDGMIKEQDLLKNKILIVNLGETLSTTKNIIGLVANKIMSKYQRPTLLLSRIEDEEGNPHLSGSGRNYPAPGIESLQHFLLESNLVDFAEGHNNACGVSIPQNNLNELLNYANEKLKDTEFIIKYDVDYVYDFNISHPEASQEIYGIAKYKEIWGQGLHEPVIAFTNVKLTPGNLFLMGAKNNTWKVSINKDLSMIKFNSSEERFDELYEPYGNVIVDLIGTCEINDWNDSAQINIIDYNIVKKNKFDF